MNQEIRKILQENIGNGVSIEFAGLPDDTYRSGVIKEVTETLVKLQWKDKSEKGEEEITVSYTDISTIRSITFNTPSIFQKDDFIIKDLVNEIKENNKKIE